MRVSVNLSSPSYFKHSVIQCKLTLTTIWPLQRNPCPIERSKKGVKCPSLFFKHLLKVSLAVACWITLCPWGWTQVLDQPGSGIKAPLIQNVSRVTCHPPRNLDGKLWDGGVYTKPFLGALSVIKKKVLSHSFMKNMSHNGSECQRSFPALLQTKKNGILHTDKRK